MKIFEKIILCGVFVSLLIVALIVKFFVIVGAIIAVITAPLRNGFHIGNNVTEDWGDALEDFLGEMRKKISADPPEDREDRLAAKGRLNLERPPEQNSQVHCCSPEPSKPAEREFTLERGGTKVRAPSREFLKRKNALIRKKLERVSREEPK